MSTVSVGTFAQKNVAVKVYPTGKGDFVYPEEQYLKDKLNVGVAFSGGGPRSAALTIGQLRALNALNILDSVKYISAISGGAWASVPYTYTTLDDIEFHGKYVACEDFTIENLKDSTSRYLVGMTRSTLREDLVEAWRGKQYDNAFASALNAFLLEPLGEEIAANDKAFSYTASYAEKISSRKENKDSERYGTPSNFLTVNPKSNRPYLIIGGTVVKQTRSFKPKYMWHFEMTPMYSGVHHSSKKKYDKLGGGYIESFGLDRKFKSKTASENIVLLREPNKVRRIFTLADMMAITGYAPGEMLSTGWMRAASGITANLGGPEIRLWSPYHYSSGRYKKIGTREFTMGDGGNMENMGIIPLLKRKVDRIIVFVNSKAAITDDVESIDGAIRRLFDDNSVGAGTTSVGVLINDEKYKRLLTKLVELKMAGKPVIFSDTYNINGNNIYGVNRDNGYDQVEIMWVYNDNFKSQYYCKLDLRIIAKVEERKEINGHFPHLGTFNVKKGISFTIQEANLLSSWSSWLIMDNKELFLDFIK